MTNSRPIALLATLLAVSTAAAAPITVTNGESFMFAAGVNDGSVYSFKSTYGPLGSYTPGSFNLASESSSVNFFGDAGFASAAGSSTSSNTNITITGSTSASSFTGGTYYGQIASDSAGIIDNIFTFGYYLEFTLDAATALLLKVNGTTSLDGDGAYADFGGILFDQGGNQLYSLGSVGGSGSFSELFTLGAGTYFLFAQSQSSATAGASAGSSFTVSLSVAEQVPEPISVAAFGGLLAAGGLAVRRMRRA